MKLAQFVGQRRLLVSSVLAAFACAAVLAAGASATPNAVGARISLLGGVSQTFPATQPFHFNHGWSVKPGTKGGALGLWRFSLALDGVEVKPDFLKILQIDDPVFGHLINREDVFNFPSGLTGTHSFSGTWSGPCDEMVANGLATGPCEQPNAVVTAPALDRTVTVTFVS